MEKAREVFVKIDEKVRNLNKNLHTCEGGCCLENHESTDGSHIHLVLNYPRQERFYLTRQLSNLLTSCLKQGNYQIIKNFVAATKYIMKGGNYWFNYARDEQDIARKDHKKFQNQKIILKLVANDTEPYFDGSIAP